MLRASWFCWLGACGPLRRVRIWLYYLFISILWWLDISIDVKVFISLCMVFIYFDAHRYSSQGFLHICSISVHSKVLWSSKPAGEILGSDISINGIFHPYRVESVQTIHIPHGKSEIALHQSLPILVCPYSEFDACHIVVKDGKYSEFLIGWILRSGS